MTEATKAKWKERVAAWRASGQTADAFAGERGFEASTLRFWASRLKDDRRVASVDNTAAVPMARVIRRRPRREQARASVSSPGELTVVVGDAQIRVGPGFDPALLRAVIAALGGAK